MEVVWDGVTRNETLTPVGAALRHDIAGAGKACRWERLFELLDGHMTPPHAVTPHVMQTPPGWRSSRSLVKLDGVEEGKPVSSLEALPPPAPGHVRLFQGRAYPSRRNN